MERMSGDEAQELLSASMVGHLALARGGEAYAIPLFYAFDGERLYFHSHPGLKDEYLDGTKEACFVVTLFEGPDTWRSVQVFGRIEKATLSDDALAALDALQKVPFPPEFGVDEAGRPKRSHHRMYIWMLAAERMSGRKSSLPRDEPGIDAA